MECFQKPIFYRDDFVPAKLTGLPSWKEKGGIPINQEVREEINKKKRLHKKWIRPKHQPDNQLIHDSYKRVKLMLQRKKDFEKKIGSNAKRNPKRFWAHISSKLKSRTGVAPLCHNAIDKSSL